MASASAMGGGMGKAIVTITIALMIIFDLAFIIMYAINLKHMNKPQTQNANI